ncbi:YybH family protein [Sulfitobacter aestuariivivens]|uniref:Nuclear transport factor 2 family protein n=1 Tax=Sulfitobacter aestuariivivens TaxID=2766981 RepID=A0A927D343_9RHOB|nr:nuclear transport factor 2 family protein [Sulfitobacter aestuariivivens]MBD3663029.1 nuclear transport factor 2 family protein [Sulfitobacter aestuariivivens]
MNAELSSFGVMLGREDIAVSEKEIVNLVETYRLAWNARDFEGMAALFSEPAMYIVPEGVLHIPDKAALVSKLQLQFVDLEAEGFDRTEIGDVVFTMVTEYSGLAELRHLRRLRTDGSEISAIDVLYICVLEEGNWRLSVAMAGPCGWNDKAGPTS